MQKRPAAACQSDLKNGECYGIMSIAGSANGRWHRRAVLRLLGDKAFPRLVPACFLFVNFYCSNVFVVLQDYFLVFGKNYAAPRRPARGGVFARQFSSQSSRQPVSAALRQ